MLFYYNRDGKYQKESSAEYKTEKGATDRMLKEKQGAVFDETGQMIISLTDEVPEGALDTNTDGSVPAYNEENEQIGTVDAEVAAKATGESAKKPNGSGQAAGLPFDVQTTCDSVRIRSGSGKGCRIVGYIREKAGNKKGHAIVEEKNGWGRLASGEGWIELAFAKKVN